MNKRMIYFIRQIFYIIIIILFVRCKEDTAKEAIVEEQINLEILCHGAQVCLKYVYRNINGCYFISELDDKGNVTYVIGESYGNIDDNIEPRADRPYISKSIRLADSSKVKLASLIEKLVEGRKIESISSNKMSHIEVFVRGDQKADVYDKSPHLMDEVLYLIVGKTKDSLDNNCATILDL